MLLGLTNTISNKALCPFWAKGTKLCTTGDTKTQQLPSPSPENPQAEARPPPEMGGKGEQAGGTQGGGRKVQTPGYKTKRSGGGTQSTATMLSRALSYVGKLPKGWVLKVLVTENTV